MTATNNKGHIVVAVTGMVSGRLFVAMIFVAVVVVAPTFMVCGRYFVWSSLSNPIKPCPHSHRKRRLSQKSATVAENGEKQRRRNRGGNGGARLRNERLRNLETAGAKVSFRPRNNLPILSAG